VREAIEGEDHPAQNGFGLGSNGVRSGLYAAIDEVTDEIRKARNLPPLN
jgi:hypothetical protein